MLGFSIPPTELELEHAWQEALIEPERQLLIRAIGLGRSDPVPRKQIARDIGVSRSRIDQQVQRQLDRLALDISLQRNPPSPEAPNQPVDELVQLLEGRKSNYQALHALRQNGFKTQDEVRAQAETLESLPGIGSVLANMIREALVSTD
jgi:hypothetical protein